MEKIKQLQEMVNNSNKIVFFGGAGVSTASGIPDFRSEEGLYKSGHKYKYQPETMLSHSFFASHQREFYEFYKETMCALGYKPNAAHYKLAELEKAGKLTAVITQNIDGLHQMAGSKNVIELHGTIHKNYCMICGREYSAEYVKRSNGVTRCEYCEYGIVKPYVTLYEEQLPPGVMTESAKYLDEADMLIIAGTSLAVYPAASLVDYFHGKYLVVINKGSVERNTFADIVIDDDLTKVFEQITV